MDLTTAWTQYKLYVQHHTADHKENVRQRVIERGLTSVMNDTKWLQLLQAVRQLPFPPAYVQKLVLENIPFEDITIDTDPAWHGDWQPCHESGMACFYAIEYLKVSPRYAQHQGRLVKPTVIDESAAFEALLKQLHIPYEEDKGIYIIYGYR
jgi:hypothetical protein